MGERVCEHPNAVLEARPAGDLMLSCDECKTWSWRAPGTGPPTLGPALIFEPGSEEPDDER